MFKEIQERALKRLSGKQFEQLLNDIFRSFGLETEMNIHLAGGEIDILLCKRTEEGKEQYYIVECKNRLQSKKKTEIRQVHRLFGLQEILKRKMDIQGSVLISTTGFTKAVTNHIAQEVLNLNAIEFDGVLDWINNHNLVDNETYFHPVYNRFLLKENRRVSIPGALLDKFKISKEKSVVFTANGREIELWDNGEYSKFFDSFAPVNYTELYKKATTRAFKL